MTDALRPLEVFLQPPPAALLEGSAVAVIDILRASTVHASLLGGGARAVYPAADWAAGHRLRGEIPASRLIGEVDSLPGPGAEYGNSPTEFAALNVHGWTVLQVTSNGTRALSAAAHAPFVLSACLRNLSACARALWRREEPIAVVCSGDHRGAFASLEDAAAAGAYVEALTALADAPLQLGNGALIALHLWRSCADDPLHLLTESPHGRDLRSLGFEADLAYAAVIDADRVVPVLIRDGAAHPRLQPL